MNTWILIATVFWYHAPSVTTQEFNSEVTCKEAARQFIEINDSNNSSLMGANATARAVCVQKGTLK